MRKTEMAIQRCKTMSTLQKILGGKWKLELLYYIGVEHICRFFSAMIFKRCRPTWNMS